MLGVSVQNSMQAVRRADILCPFSWSYVSSLMRFHDETKEQTVCIKFCEISKKSAMKTLAMIRQAFGEESMSRTQVFEWHAWSMASRTSIEDDQHRYTTLHNA
jgi:hypothetical protein